MVGYMFVVSWEDSGSSVNSDGVFLCFFLDFLSLDGGLRLFVEEGGSSSSFDSAGSCALGVELSIPSSSPNLAAPFPGPPNPFTPDNFSSTRPPLPARAPPLPSSPTSSRLSPRPAPTPSPLTLPLPSILPPPTPMIDLF